MSERGIANFINYKLKNIHYIYESYHPQNRDIKERNLRIHSQSFMRNLNLIIKTCLCIIFYNLISKLYLHFKSWILRNQFAVRIRVSAYITVANMKMAIRAFTSHDSHQSLLCDTQKKVWDFHFLCNSSAINEPTPAIIIKYRPFIAE